MRDVIAELKAALEPFVAWHKVRERQLGMTGAAHHPDDTPIFGAASAGGEAIITLGDLRRARAALTLLDKMGGLDGDGWMPIESAPHGPSQLILGHSEQRWIRFGRYYPEFRKWYYSGTNERQQYSETEGGKPTHWRPLPTPPAALGAPEKGNGQ